MKIKKYTVQIFDSIGTWISDYNIKVMVDANVTVYDQIGLGIRNAIPDFKHCQARSKRLHSWMAFTRVDGSPVIVWFN